MDRKIRNRRIEKMLDFVELTDRASSLVSTLSGGMKRRLKVKYRIHPSVQI